MSEAETSVSKTEQKAEEAARAIEAKLKRLGPLWGYWQKLRDTAKSDDRLAALGITVTDYDGDGRDPLMRLTISAFGKTAEIRAELNPEPNPASLDVRYNEGQVLRVTLNGDVFSVAPIGDQKLNYSRDNLDRSFGNASDPGALLAAHRRAMDEALDRLIGRALYSDPDA